MKKSINIELDKENGELKMTIKATMNEIILMTGLLLHQQTADMAKKYNERWENERR